MRGKIAEKPQYLQNFQVWVSCVPFLYQRQIRHESVNLWCTAPYQISPRSVGLLSSPKRAEKPPKTFKNRDIYAYEYSV